MKYLSLYMLLICFSNCNAQTALFDTLLRKGKAEFKKEDDKQDYAAAIRDLKKALIINPNNTECRYFLGYAYSRLNSKDATSIPNMQLPLVINSSVQFEKIIQLSPLYTGEIISLDPYSKITAEWGSLALSYISKNKPDSVAMAFTEGKKRGGFDDFILSINRAILNTCSKNAILIPAGDNFTFPLYYLQTVEKLRTDVSVVDPSLLGTIWYPQILQSRYSIKFDIKSAIIDTLDYTSWADTTISIPIAQTDKHFSWLVKPTYQEHYILRGDRLLISLLKQNQFKRDLYFTKGFNTDEQLNLGSNLLSLPILDKLNVRNEQPMLTTQYIKEVEKIISGFKSINKNSPEELLCIDFIRTDIINKIQDNNQPSTKSLLLDLLKNKLALSIYPSYSETMKDNLNAVDIE